MRTILLFRQAFALICWVILLTTNLSCFREEAISCYDPELAREAQTWGCLANCPGVKGCDGQQYCNECYAAQAGIRVR
ncbi:MAG: hypothetical protein SF053_08975 [Bacteroidia bacterium]|nr:hypothetical protein [Bacteroidia bacterium]